MSNIFHIFFLWYYSPTITVTQWGKKPTVRFKPRQLISSNYTGALAKLTSKHENSHSALPEVIYSVGVPLNKINGSLQKIFQTATF